MLNGENDESIAFRSRSRQGCPLLLLLFSIVLEILARAKLWKRKKIKGHLNWKERCKKKSHI